MAQVDTGGAPTAYVRKRRKRVSTAPPRTPDQADRSRTPAQKRRDRRGVESAIETAKTRARVTPDQADRERTPAQRARDRAAVRTSVAESRLKVLRKQHRGSGTRQLKAELEGRGKVAEVLSSLADRAAKNAGGGQPILGRTPKYASVINDNLGSRAVKDVVNLPGQIVPGVYIPAVGAYEKATGRPERLDKFMADLKQHDPIYNAAAAGYEKAKGNDKAAASHWRKAKTAASEHPGFTVLEARGLRAPVGRGAGAAVRTTAKVTGSETLRKVGTTERAPKTLKGTSLVEHRAYSKNLIRKGEQVLKERDARRKSNKYREQARRETDPKRKKELKAKARQHDPDIIRDKDIQVRVDEHAAAAEAVRRINQAELLKTEGKALKGAKKAGPIVSLLAQRITRPTLENLRSYRNDLVAAGRTLEGAKKVANEQLVQDLSTAIERVESGKLKLPELKQIADQYAGRAAVRQAELTAPERGIYDPEEAARRGALPHAVREGKVERNLPLLKEREKAASAAERKAKAKAKNKQRAASSRRQKHRSEEQRVQQRLSALPQREPSAHAALEALEKAGLKKSQTQVTRATNRATKASNAAKAAKGETKAAKALRRADPWLLKGTIRPVKTSTLERWVQDEHGAPGAIVTQRPPGLESGADFYQSGMRPPGGQDRRYTGKATTEGTASHSNETLVRQQARTKALADAFDTYKRFVDEFALRRGGGARGKGPKPFKNYDDAMQAAMDRSSKGDVEWTVIRLTPRGGNKAQLQAMLAGDEGGIGDIVQAALKGEGDGPFAIVPKAAAQRLQSHMTALAPTTLKRGVRGFQSTVRRAILATSLPWAIGNVGEASFRSALNRVTPRHYVTGRRILKAIDEQDAELAKIFQARTTGGGHYAFADRTIYSNVDAMEAGLIRDLTATSQKLRQMPVGKQAAWVWDRYTHHVFDLTRRVEEQFQTAMLGKAAREHLMTPTLQKLSTQAIKDMARDGKIDANLASKLGREIDTMYGKYSKWSPQMREAVAMYTPFLAWTRNALTFLMEAPVRHELATATSTAAVNATEDERAKWDPKDLPTFLRGGIPTEEIPPEFRKLFGLKPGGHWKPGRFTPLGIGTDPTGAVAGTVLPQFEGILRAMQGQDWTGRKLKVKGGGEPQTGDKLQAAVMALFDETIPFLGVTRRTKEKGPQALLHSAIGYIPPGKSKQRGGSSSMALPESTADDFGDDFGGDDFDADFEDDDFQ